MREEDKLYELIAKELTSDISEHEKEKLQNNFIIYPEIKSKYNIIEKYWKNYFPKVKFNNSIEKTETKLGFSNRMEKANNSILIYKIAVSLILLVSITYYGYQQFREKPHISLNEYSAGPGEVKKFILSDGTKVWLNSYSALVASEPFTKENREVLLVGEGYFEVAHNPDRPFIVKTPYNLKTKVLGTHFNISAYPDDPEQEISLYEGSIELSGFRNSGKNILIKPGEKVIYEPSDKDINVIPTVLGKPAEWRDGILRFYNEKFSSIAKKLERKFQTKIVITDEKVGKLHFTGNFEEEPLIKIMKLLNEAQEFTFKKYEDSIIIQSKNT